METSWLTNSMSKATMCCLRSSRCLMRKSCESVGEWRDAICVAAAKRESVVWWTIWWARSSKTVDWEGC